MTDDYSMSRMYMTDQELSVLNKLSILADEKAVCDLSMEENNLLKFIISQYTKQKN